jgi:hypothetical protein
MRYCDFSYPKGNQYYQYIFIINCGVSSEPFSCTLDWFILIMTILNWQFFYHSGLKKIFPIQYFKYLGVGEGPVWIPSKSILVAPGVLKIIGKTSKMLPKRQEGHVRSSWIYSIDWTATVENTRIKRQKCAKEKMSDTCTAKMYTWVSLMCLVVHTFVM